MNSGHSYLIHSIATTRIEEFRATAERDRLIRDAGLQSGVPSVMGIVRRFVGNVLVRTGERVHGGRTVRPAAERVAAATALRIAR